MSMLAPGDLLPVDARTRFRDYILTAYPLRAPALGKPHVASLLRSLLRRDGLLDSVWPIVERLREVLGPDETVWGWKRGPKGPSVELYLYNFVANRRGNRSRASAIAEVLRGLRDFPALPDEALPYFMWSFEAPGADPLRIYLGSGDRHRTGCGFSYRQQASLVAENHYAFYAAAKAEEREDARARLAASARGIPDAAMTDDLLDCHTVCYAVKPRADGLYYSRLPSGVVAAWFERRGDAELAETLRDDGFDYARWDLGFDFERRGETTVIVKHALHGVV